MMTGISSDETKARLRALLNKIDQHQRAVDDVVRDYGDRTVVRDYEKDWINYRKKVAALLDEAESWTSITLGGAVQNAEVEFGIFLTKFAALSAKLTAAKSAEKVKALETVLANTPAARDAFKKDAVVSLTTDATPIAQAKPESEIPKWIVPVSGLAGLLFLLKKIFLG